MGIPCPLRVSKSGCCPSSEEGFAAKTGYAESELRDARSRLSPSADSQATAKRTGDCPPIIYPTRLDSCSICSRIGFCWNRRNGPSPLRIWDDSYLSNCAFFLQTFHQQLILKQPIPPDLLGHLYNNKIIYVTSLCPSILFSALFYTMRGMPPVRILTGQPSLANNPSVANTGNAPSL